MKISKADLIEWINKSVPEANGSKKVSDLTVDEFKELLAGNNKVINIQELVHSINIVSDDTDKITDMIKKALLGSLEDIKIDLGDDYYNRVEKLRRENPKKFKKFIEGKFD